MMIGERNKMANAKLSFEKALEKLEQVVAALESDELTLEKALKQFEEGMKLSKLCNQKLDETEKKISMIMENSDGSMEPVPLNSSETPTS